MKVADLMRKKGTRIVMIRMNETVEMAARLLGGRTSARSWSRTSSGPKATRRSACSRSGTSWPRSPTTARPR